jgi:hypothetical protein
MDHPVRKIADFVEDKVDKVIISTVVPKMLLPTVTVHKY